MNDTERFLFDCQGFLHIPSFLPAAQVEVLLRASKELEQHALACETHSSRFRSIIGFEYWKNEEFGYLSSYCGTHAGDRTLGIDDFWLFSSVFDQLVGHEPTMRYVKRLINSSSYRYSGPDGIMINNAELRMRYTGNASPPHMGYPRNTNRRFSYYVDSGGVCSAAMIRMVYFLHDVDVDQGPICFIPGSHRTAFEPPVPKGTLAEDEPGMIPILVKAGDAVLFTEACRHGGVTNRSTQTRYTLHVGYGPDFLSSHNLSSQDAPMNVTPGFLERLTSAQRDLLVRKGLEPIEAPVAQPL
jgi:hypothetical protein